MPRDTASWLHAAPGAAERLPPSATWELCDVSSEVSKLLVLHGRERQRVEPWLSRRVSATLYERMSGYNAIYISAHDMLTQLRAARADATHERRMLRFTSPELLVIDDLGLRPLVSDEPIDLYEIIRQRYEHGSTIITSNRAIEEWPPLFGDLVLASAALDRLLHHSQVIEMDGDSFRNPPPAKRERVKALHGRTP
jgi:IstB-like ATP binding protein